MKQDNIVRGIYTSVWEGEGEITSPAEIDLKTSEVIILESYDPSELLTEDGEPFECKHLEKEYVTIDGTDYPCHNISDTNEWENEDGWTSKSGFYYR